MRAKCVRGEPMAAARPAAPPAHRGLEPAAAAAAAAGTSAAALAARPCRGPSPKGLAGAAALLQTRSAQEKRVFLSLTSTNGLRAPLRRPRPARARCGAVPGQCHVTGEGPRSGRAALPAAPEPGLLQPALEPAHRAARNSRQGPLPAPGTARLPPPDPWKSMSTTVHSDMLSPGRTALCWTEQGAITAPQWHWRWWGSAPDC